MFSSAEDRRLFVCYPAWSRAGQFLTPTQNVTAKNNPKHDFCKICAKICLGMWMPCFSLPTRDFVVLSWVLSHAPAVMPLLLSPSSCPPAPPLPPAECQINWSRVLLWCGLMLILRHRYFWLLLDFILWQSILKKDWPIVQVSLSLDDICNSEKDQVSINFLRKGFCLYPHCLFEFLPWLQN